MDDNKEINPVELLAELKKAEKRVLGPGGKVSYCISPGPPPNLVQITKSAISCLNAYAEFIAAGSPEKFTASNGITLTAISIPD